MNIAIALFHYFPYGGLQRDFYRISEKLTSLGHKITVFTMQWRGEMPQWLNVQLLPVRAFTHHQRCKTFIQLFLEQLQQQTFDRVIGFNKMPGLDFYYAADPCFKARYLNPFYRLLPRYRVYQQLEKAVFARGQTTKILMISERETKIYQRHYRTEPERLFLLPPGINLDRKRPGDAETRRKKIRHQFNFSDHDFIWLFIASSFKTKGLNRVLKALDQFPHCKLLIIGDDQLSIKKNNIIHLGAISNIIDYLVAADLLVHPALMENTGTVLLEALVAGLPVLTTDICGYASYITQAQAGEVITSPFSQTKMHVLLKKMLDHHKLKHYQQHALEFAAHEDLYSLFDRAVEVIVK